MSKTTPSGVQTGYSNGWRDKLNCFREKNKAKLGISRSLYKNISCQMFKYLECLDAKKKKKSCTSSGKLIKQNKTLMDRLTNSEEAKDVFYYLQWSNGSRRKFACGISGATKKHKCNDK